MDATALEFAQEAPHDSISADERVARSDDEVGGRAGLQPRLWLAWSRDEAERSR